MLRTTRLGRRNTLIVAYGLVLVAVVSCQLVAGIKSRQADPLLVGCAFPTGSGPLVRFADLLPTSDLVDVCMRPTGASSWGLPILLNGGSGSDDAGTGTADNGCATALGSPGFAYQMVSKSFNAPAGTIDVEAVPYGSGCDATPLSQSGPGGLTLATGGGSSYPQVTTLASIGGNGASPAIVALPEATSSDSNLRIRLVNAMPGLGGAAGAGTPAALDFGLCANATLPSTIETNLLKSPVAYATAPAADTTLTFGSVEPNGYFTTLPSKLNFGAAIDGDTTKAALFDSPQSTVATLSLYAIGIRDDTAHPARGLVCDEDPQVSGSTSTTICPTTAANPELIPCCGTALPSISVDVFDSALYGPNAPNQPERLPLIGPAIAQRTSDVICLLEVDDSSYQTRIIKDTAAAYPYSYVLSPQTTSSTPPTNPVNQEGVTPAAPTAPPCDGIPASYVQAAITCGETNCSGPVGDGGVGGGVISPNTDCISSFCAGQFISIQGQGTTLQGDTCFDCLIDQIAGNATWGETLTTCTTVNTPSFAFEGQTSTMILSRYPLSNQDSFILPSTLYRRTVLYSQVNLPGNLNVDFFCGILSSTTIAADEPYAGNYGGTATTSQGEWDNENTYQAQQLIQWVAQKSGSTSEDGGTTPGKGGTVNPAIVVGQWASSFGDQDYADAGLPDAGPNNLVEQNVQTMLEFQSAASQGWTFVIGPPPWYQQCNYCPGVEGNGPNQSNFTSQPFLVNWPQAASATIGESLFFTKTESLGGDAGTGALSTYYGVNFQVQRPSQ